MSGPELMELREQLNALIARGREEIDSWPYTPDGGFSAGKEFRAGKGMLLEATAEVGMLQDILRNEFITSFGITPAVAFNKGWGRSGDGVILDGTHWRCYFHGVECDFRHQQDGRFLSIDWLPLGLTGITSVRGLTGYLQATRPPWREFAHLRTLLGGVSGRSVDRCLLLGRELVQEGKLVWLAGTCFALSKTVASRP